MIVSTRKLVYDAGSAEEAIKSLMQAQHKAVLKDLKRGHFDDKIDQYLGGTPGLLPRGAVDDHAEPTNPERASPPEIARPSQPVMAEMVEATFGQRTDAEIAMSREPTIEEPAIGLRPTEPAVEQRLPARTASGDMQRLLARTASGDLHRLLARTVSGDDISIRRCASIRTTRSSSSSTTTTMTTRPPRPTTTTSGRRGGGSRATPTSPRSTTTRGRRSTSRRSPTACRAGSRSRPRSARRTTWRRRRW